MGRGEGLTQPYLYSLCDLGLVASLRSMKTETQHLPWPLTSSSLLSYSDDKCVRGWGAADPKSLRRPQNAISSNAIWLSSVVRVSACPCAGNARRILFPEGERFRVCQASESTVLLSPLFWPLPSPWVKESSPTLSSTGWANI